MKHNILHGSTRCSEKNFSALGSLNAAETAHLDYGGSRQAVAVCGFFAVFSAGGTALC